MPPFRRGSGGHMTLFTIATELERAGHSCSIWIHDPEGRMRRPRGRRPPGADRALRAAARRGVQRLRRLARRGRRVRDRLADRVPAVDAAGLQAEGISGAGLRARFLLRVGGAPVGGGDLPHGLRLRRREPVAGATCCASGTARPPMPSSSASTSTSTAHSTCRARDDDRRLLCAPLDAAPRNRAGAAGARRGRPAAAGTARRAVRRHEAARERRSRTSSAACSSRTRSRASTTRPPSAS